MALIGKIREKSVLLVIIIGVALLAFIAGDYFSTRGGGVEGKYGVGHVFGEKVDINRYEYLRSKYQESAWPILVDSLVMTREYLGLGISVSDNN